MIVEIIKKMPLEKFIEDFLYLWDSRQKKYRPWQLWPKQKDICKILDSKPRIFWPKARQVGGSQIAAAKAVKTALEEPNADIFIISKNDRKARSFLKKRVLPLLKALPGKGIIDPIKGIDFGDWSVGVDKVEFTNGSNIYCIPTEDDAARGETARLVIMDEAATMQHAGDVWKSASPATEQHHGGQIVVISNSKPGSWFNNMLTKIISGKMDGVTMYFMSLWTDPKRDEIWAKQRRTQFDNDIDFRLEYPENVQDMLLKREGFVFPTFDAKENGKHVYSFDNDWLLPLLYGYDHGFDHFAVFLFLLYDKYNDHLYVFDEIFASQKDTYEVSLMINARIKSWHDRGMPEEAWKKIADSSIFAERGQKTVADLLRVYTKISFQKSLKHDEEGSTNLLRARFTRNKISIHPRCTETIRQIRDLMFSTTGKAIDRDNDSTDILRYICAEIRQEAKPDEKPPRRHYNKDGEKDFLAPKQSVAPSQDNWNDWMKY